MYTKIHHEVTSILLFVVNVLVGTLENTEKITKYKLQYVVRHSKHYLNKIIGIFLLLVRRRESNTSYQLQKLALQINYCLD